ncbi:hypothetical protein BKA62DRAFT_707687 [Auriculariales sp. MPI-PUGE-AT-0066]|nr:hypothetical protein BKA62DRAFT_707687 [Auriculariales sp. MPI-PUGE-AT-0066]
MTMLRILSVLVLTACARAVLPAQPSDDLSQSLDTNSTLYLSWYPFGALVVNGLSFRSKNSLPISGKTEGAFTRFSEADISSESNDYALTPWIAYISCDPDRTPTSTTTDDTLTLAKRRGAVAVVLYSMNATTCAINKEFESSLPALQLDIFATTSPAMAQLIDAAFANTNSSFGSYNAAQLDASKEAVVQTLTSHNAREVSYLIASLESDGSNSIPTSQGVVDAATRTMALNHVLLAIILFGLANLWNN